MCYNNIIKLNLNEGYRELREEVIHIIISLFIGDLETNSINILLHILKHILIYYLKPFLSQ